MPKMAATLTNLPNEVIFQIFLCLGASSIPTLQLVCRDFNNISQQLLWRTFCRLHFKYWSSDHSIEDKYAGPIDDIDWKNIFTQRYTMDCSVSRKLDSILSSQSCRTRKAQMIVERGYDAKDTLLRHFRVEDDAEDVLARRFYSDAVLSCLHRSMGIGEWVKLKNGQPVPLERALAAFDMFVLHDRKGDFKEITTCLDNIAEQSRIEDPDFKDRSPRQKAIVLAKYLHKHNLIGIEGNVSAHYHDLQNNFVGIALHDKDKDHPSLPLITVAIYCCVARRLGLDASPCGFPLHVHAIVKPPPGENLDGQEARVDGAPPPMYMDPFRSTSETAVEDLKAQLVSMGIPAREHAVLLEASSTEDIIRRSAKNIITSVRTFPRNNGPGPIGDVVPFPELEGSYYAALWALILFPEGHPTIAAVQRARYLPYLADHVERRFHLDLWLLEKHVLPLFSGSDQYDDLQNTIAVMGASDSMPTQPKTRNVNTSNVKHDIGTVFQHARYHYYAVIVGWDPHCAATEAWISQMGVHLLPNGKHQSFFNVLTEDQSSRYVAEENINPVHDEARPKLLALAGQYLKRWDGQRKVFVSNIKEEYPDD